MAEDQHGFRVNSSRSVPMIRLNISRILDYIPGQLRECVAESMDTLSLHLESTLLRHRCVPAEVYMDVNMSGSSQVEYTDI